MTYKTSEAQRERDRNRKRKASKVGRCNLLRSDSLRPAMLDTREVGWAVGLIQALRERHP